MEKTIISGLTNEGLRLLGLSQMDEHIVFSRFKIGDGIITDENPVELKELINTIGELDIDESKIINNDENSVSLKVTSIIKQAEQGYYFRELGLFAYDPETNQEVLYAYVNKGDKATYIPSLSEKIATEEKASMIVAIGNSSNITVNYTSELKTDAIDSITSVMHKRNIGELIWSSLPLADGTLCLANGTKLEKDGTYSAFVKYMQDLKNKNPNSNWYCSEDEWNNIAGTYGACGKYVVEEDYVRLPKVTGFVEGTIDSDALGTLVEAGLPNITGGFNASELHDGSPIVKGAFKKGGMTTKPTPNVGSDQSQTGFSFDASLSDQIYGNSTTVQPQAIQQFIYIVVSTASVSSDDVSMEYNENGILSKMNDITNTFETTKASIRTNTNAITELTTLVNSYNNAIQDANTTAEEVSSQFEVLQNFINNINVDIVKINGDNQYINVQTNLSTEATINSSNEDLMITCTSVPEFNSVGTNIYTFTYTDKIVNEDELTSERWVDEYGSDVDLAEDYSLEVVGTPVLEDTITLTYTTYRKFEMSYDDTILNNKADRDDLSDYYTKDETYTRTEVDNRINFATGVSTDGFYSATEVDELLEQKANKTDIPTKLSQFENDEKYVVETVLNTKVTDINKELNKCATIDWCFKRVPNGTIIQSYSAYMDNSSCIECNGEKLNILGESENPKITLYPLVNITENGKNYLTELYTSNKYVCSNEMADVDDLYYYDRKTGKYRHIEEDISMSKGVVTSESGFFDGEHEVDKEHSIETTVNDMWYREFDVPNKKIKDILPDCYHNGEILSDKQLPTMTGYNCYSAAETDRTISCNGYLTNIIDGKANTVGTYDSETETWSTLDLTDKTSLDFWLEFDWITPSQFKAGEIIHGYRAFRLLTTAEGDLKFYLAGYKSSNSLKWKVSGVNTGIVLEPNTKYKIAVKSWESLKREMNTNITSNPNLYIDTYTIKGYTITVAPYLKDYENRNNLDYENQQAYCVLTTYAPYNYYNSYGMRTLYHADASVYAGGFLDLYNMKIWMKGLESTYPELENNNQNSSDRSVFTPLYTSGSIQDIAGIEQGVYNIWATGSDVVELTGTTYSGSINRISSDFIWDGSKTYFYDGDLKSLLEQTEYYNSISDEDIINLQSEYPYVVNKIWTPLSKYSQTTKEIESGFYAPYIPPKNGMKYYKVSN